MLKRLLALMAALTLLTCSALAEMPATPTDLATEAPTAQPTAQPTQEPTAAPTQEPTAEPTQAPTPDPTEEPTQEPTATPDPTPEPWDESLCDHANGSCVQAPVCQEEGCMHIGSDVHGLEVPLCSKGRWLLDQQDALARSGAGSMARTVRSDTIDLTKGDAVIWRSGSYKVKGGTESSSLTITGSRLVVLDMTDALLETLTLGDHVNLTWKTHGESRVGAFVLGKDCEVRIPGSGALTITRLTRPAEESGGITITGGSVQAGLEEASGRTMHVFEAKGMTGATVQGESISASTAHKDGSAYLWLTPAGENQQWVSALTDGVLALALEDVLPPAAEEGIIQGQENVLLPGTWELAGAIAEGTRLVIDQPGVTLRLSDATFAGALVAASQPYTVYADGQCSLGSLAGSVTIHADGKLTLGNVPEDAVYHGGTIVLPQAPDGWQLTQTKASGQTVTLDGEKLPLLVNPDGYAYLPAPADNVTYTIDAAVDRITVLSQENLDKHFILSDAAPDASAGAAPYFTVQGSGDYVTGSITAAGATASAELRNVKLQSDGPVLRVEDEHLTMTLTGDNGLVSSGNAIELKGDAFLTLNVLSGRLLVRRQTSTAGLTLKGNIKLEPESTLPHLQLMIRDSKGNPVPNRALTVLIGTESYAFTTHFDGSIHLWGMGDMDGRSIAATDGEEVFTAVVEDGEAEAHTGLTIRDEAVTETDGALVVTFTCEGAASVGVQAFIGDEKQDMPDTFQAGAKRFKGENGSVTITGAKPGQTVSLRVYASSAANAALTKDSADGFQFGKLMHITLRKAWSTSASADAVYTGKAYKNPLTLPEGATVTYSGKALSKGKPVQVGKYTMHVTIPEGDSRWLSGTVDIPFEIKAITLTIRPEPNQEKYCGDADPVLAYTAEGLLSGDEVTGEMTRQAGEEEGNYAYTIGSLKAAAYYTLCLAEDAPTFTILPAPVTGGGSGTGEVLKPVRQEIVRKDGRTLAVTLKTQETLQVNWSTFGQVMLGSDDGKTRPFTPSLSWNAETDEVLLRLRAEAELNKDGGYQTDHGGEPLWTGRQLRLGWMGIRHLEELGVDGIAFINDGAALTVPLASFLSAEMEKLVKENEGNLASVRFRLDLIPAQAEAGELRPVSQGWRAAVVMLIDRREIDITAQVQGLAIAVDMESIAQLLQEMDLYDEKAFSGQFQLALGAERLQSCLVQPYAAGEMEAADYPQVMFANRYLRAPLAQAGVVCVVRSE